MYDRKKKKKFTDIWGSVVERINYIENAWTTSNINEKKEQKKAQQKSEKRKMTPSHDSPFLNCPLS